jgi:hypothetical protein
MVLKVINELFGALLVNFVEVKTAGKLLPAEIKQLVVR